MPAREKALLRKKSIILTNLGELSVVVGVASVDKHETARGNGAVEIAVAVARLTQLPSRQDLRLENIRIRFVLTGKGILASKDFAGL